MNNDEYIPLDELDFVEWQKRLFSKWIKEYAQRLTGQNMYGLESLTVKHNDLTEQTFILNQTETNMPTVEQRLNVLESKVQRLNDKVFGVEPGPIFKIRNHLKLETRNVLGFPHAQVWWNTGTQDYNLYIRRQVEAGANNYESLTGSKLQNLVLSNPAIALPTYSTVINSPIGLYATKHTWYGNPMMPYGQFYKYNDGWRLLKQDTEPSGEDRGVFWCEEWDEFIMYCRRDPYTDRRLAVYSSPNFIDWTLRANNFTPASIHANSRFYSAGGFILGDRLYAITNVIDYDDWTVSPMIHIARSVGNFYRSQENEFRTFQLTEFFPEVDDDHIKQLFVYPHVVNNKVVFTCIKCLEPHEHPNNPTGVHWTEVWDMPVADFLTKVGT